ncbi:MAG: Lrp/AsnC ligand binding domain-containing protein [Streptomyces sp.]|nr:Lrp/AsnC ligand binding domain-containing protein [Streptomyces sp.]
MAVPVSRGRSPARFSRFDATLVCRDTAHFADLVTRRLPLIDGILATDSFFVLEVHKQAYGWGRRRSGDLPPGGSRPA